MKGRVLVRKLGFLKRVMGRGTDSLSGCVVLALCNEVDSICLVRECRELEESFGTRFTEAITCTNLCCLREMKNAIMEVDRRRLLERCEEKAPMIAKVAECPGWANYISCGIMLLIWGGRLLWDCRWSVELWATMEEGIILVIYVMILPYWNTLFLTTFLLYTIRNCTWTIQTLLVVQIC